MEKSHVAAHPPPFVLEYRAQRACRWAAGTSPHAACIIMTKTQAAVGFHRRGRIVRAAWVWIPVRPRNVLG